MYRRVNKIELLVSSLWYSESWCKTGAKSNKKNIALENLMWCVKINCYLIAGIQISTTIKANKRANYVCVCVYTKSMNINNQWNKTKIESQSIICFSLMLIIYLQLLLFLRLILPINNKLFKDEKKKKKKKSGLV